MKNLVKLSIITGLIFSIISCRLFSPPTNQPIEITLTDEKPIVVLDTGNSNYPRIALFKSGEVLVPVVNVSQSGEVSEVKSALLVTPDGKSIYFYFENGLPVRAIAEDHLVQFENFTGSTVDITVIAPDGTIGKKQAVPFDMNQISPISSQAGKYLASMAEKPISKDIDWLSFASTAIGVFSCAATFATAGTLAITFGVGCGLFVYETYLKLVEKEPPVPVKGTTMLISGVGCAAGIVSKQPLGLAECASLVVDVVEIARQKSQETEQKLTTMAGGNPTVESELVSQATIAPEPTPTTEVMQEPQESAECSQLNLTPEECRNARKTQYEFNITHCPPDLAGLTCEELFALNDPFVIFNSDQTMELSVIGFGRCGVDRVFKKAQPNVYVFEYPDCFSYKVTFTSNGFIYYAGIGDFYYEVVYTIKD